ncbi:CoA-binding protein, partial [Streptomyces sp. NPDC055078]
MTEVAGNQLAALFNPASIAVIGASDDPNRIGGRPLRYLSEFGFRGAIHPINPNRDQVQGVPAYPSVAAVGAPVDLAIVAVAADRVVPAIKECAAAGVRGAVVFSAGFAEAGPSGQAAQEELRQIAAETGIRVFGPNCLGFMNVRSGVIATFTAGLDGVSDIGGNIAVVSQSGALGSHLLAAAHGRGLGFSLWATTGNEVDVDFAECLEYAVQDPHTDVAMVYAEGVRHGPRLHAALAEAQRRRKPVVLLKVGSSTAGAAAAASHTGSIVGSDGAYDAVFRHYGVLRVRTFREWLDVGEACAQGRFPTGKRIGLI